MKNIYALTAKELYSYFNSALAYVIIAIFTFLGGAFFAVDLTQQGSHDLTNTFIIWIIILLLVCPFLTMNLVAEERRNGTMELLMTSPLRDWQIAIGKYLGFYIFYIFMLLPTLFFALLDYKYALPQLETMLTTYLALLLVGLLITGIGLMISSFTSSPLIAAGGTFMILFFLWLVNVFSGLIGQDSPHAKDVINYLGILSHAQTLGKGVIDTKDIVYFVSLTVLCIFITSKSIEARRYTA